MLLTGGAVVPELQQVQVNGAGGSFTLRFDGETTAGIPHGAAAATVKSELETLGNIALVTVTGSGTANNPYVVQFDDPGGDVPQMTADGALLTGGSGHAVTTVNASAGTNEQQTITLVNTAAGTFTVQFRGSTSAAIAWDASAASLEAILEGIATIGAGNVSVTGAAGGPWTVTFVVALGTENVELLIGDDSGLTGTPGSDIRTGPSRTGLPAASAIECSF